MSRIKITCSEKDKTSLLYCIMESTECPCDDNKCGEFKECSECINKNIEFEIIKKDVTK